MALEVARPVRLPPDHMSICYCTLAIHPPYRDRARLLCQDLAPARVLVLTDAPADFDDLPVHTIAHQPTGPMAVDYREKLGPTGNGQGAAAYHDKRFALEAALRFADTAIFLDADSRVTQTPPALAPAPGLAAVPVVSNSISGHLEACGTWRLPAFRELATVVTGGCEVLRAAPWCHESCLAVTRDPQTSRFFETWDRVALWMQRNDLFSGEGGAIGLAAFCAGWTVDWESLSPLWALVQHESGGPK